MTLLQGDEDLRAEVAIALKALEEGRYTDYDAESLEGLFDGIKRKGRSCFGRGEIAPRWIQKYSGSNE